MKVSRIPFNFELTDAAGRRMGEGRSVGLHMSQVLRYIRVVGLGEKKLSKAGGDLFMMMGFLFEGFVEEAFRRYMLKADDTGTRQLVAQNEMELDGIFMTPDALEINESEGILYEYKATWKSLKKFMDIEEHFWHWLVQVKAYCWGLGVNKARLVCFFVMGDYTYKPPFGGPGIHAVELEFTDAELKENWQMLLDNAEPARKWLAEGN